MEKNDQLIIETEKGQETILVNAYRPSDRYSNGSFVIDTEKDGDLVRVWKQPKEDN